ncbi:VOC family protein [Flagellimonas algicola]|uniref:Glyoxalase/bleomycin resistance protein/dioxygenase superfamily protein n=1 Tax=Flagellimonas algicola TaxID=2583815 RepID=A0ABY2WFV0_9FLAO|nr:VOC family protein [Allomuricauda algicola]TMU50405.1 hypothetical protein FGG15_19855 [Allomuricauda algicola]
MLTIETAHLDHQSFLVQDLEIEAKTLSDLLGLSFNVWTITPEICMVNEKIQPYAFKVAIAPIGTSSIELISPLRGNSILQQDLKIKGVGYHHSGITFNDHRSFANAKIDLIAKGYKPVQYGKTKGAFEFGYFRLPTAGITIELLYIDTMPQPDAIISKIIQ